MPDPEPVELVLQDYKFTPGGHPVKMKWKRGKSELWIQTDKGIVRYHRPWLLLQIRRWFRQLRGVWK